MISQIVWLSALTDSVQELLTNDSSATLQDFLNFTEARQLTMQTPILTGVQKYGEALENGSWPMQKPATIRSLHQPVDDKMPFSGCSTEKIKQCCAEW